MDVMEINRCLCFICGSMLKEAGFKTLQCNSESCGEVFRYHKDWDNNLHMVLIKTPFTPNITIEKQ